MSIQTQPGEFRLIPVSQLVLSKLNVRKSGGDAGIGELAALIQSQGVLQNLTVVEDGKDAKRGGATFAVVAGGRRWRALQKLLKERHIRRDYEVPCSVVNAERALDISIAENSGREAMHPADQFNAFRRLIDAGQSVEDVAARFGITPLVVQRRLKLANVCPAFVAMYRDGKLTLDHLMAFALTDDHAKQQHVWKSLKPYERNPHSIRQALTEHELPICDASVKFVGLAAYEKAGGAVRRDLFAEEEGGFIIDVALLHQLAAQKLAQYAEQIRAEGFAFVDVSHRFDYSELAVYGRVQTVEREPTEQEQAKLNAMATERADIEEQTAEAEADDNDDRLTALASRANNLDAEEALLTEARTTPNPDQVAVSGALVTIDRDGKVRVERGLLKPEDAKRFAAIRRANGGDAAAQAPRIHSAALLRRLTAHRTLALQAKLAECPSLALAALTHRLALRTFYPEGRSSQSAVQITATVPELHQHGSDIAACKASGELETRRQALRAALPDDGASLMEWLLQQSQTTVLELFSFCVAITLNGVQADEGPHAVDGLARAARLDMREWWKPTASAYLASVSRARILAIVTEAVSAKAAEPLAKMKKVPMAQAAEQLLADTGWLPEVLRTIA